MHLRMCDTAVVLVYQVTLEINKNTHIKQYILKEMCTYILCMCRHSGIQRVFMPTLLIS